MVIGDNGIGPQGATNREVIAGTVVGDNNFGRREVAAGAVANEDAFGNQGTADPTALKAFARGGSEGKRAGRGTTAS